MRLLVKKLDPQASTPEYKTRGAAAFDLASLETKTLAPGEIYRFRTGLVFVIPKDHFMLIVSRSSNAPKNGFTMANGTGIIDSDYRGETDEVLVPLLNVSTQPVTITAGDRIAQAIILPSPQIEIVDTLSTDSVDRGGFGSTGK